MSIITLDGAIKIYLANQKNYLSSIISKAVRHHTEIHIAVFEKTPRDSKIIERQIKQKEKEKDQAIDVITTEQLWTEIQALQQLLAIVRRHEQGQDLSGLVY